MTSRGERGEDRARRRAWDIKLQTLLLEVSEGRLSVAGALERAHWHGYVVGAAEALLEAKAHGRG
jgi:hypothetical protein